MYNMLVNRFREVSRSTIFTKIKGNEIERAEALYDEMKSLETDVNSE